MEVASDRGSTAQIGKSIRREILLQDKVWKTQEYFVSFKFFKPQYWSIRSAEGRRRIGVVMPKKKKSRPAAATVGRRAAFRKTRTVTVFSLTEGPPKRKFFL